MIFDGGGAVAELGAPVLVVTGAERDQRPVIDVAQAHDAESRRQRLVGAPVTRQRRAQNGRTGRRHQIRRQTQTGHIVRIERSVGR